MKSLFTLLIAIFCLNVSTYAQVSYAESMPHDGMTRWYRIHLPPDFSTESVLPVVLNFHGLGSNAQQQEIYSQFNNVADTAHIIVVYPEGVDNIWNVGFGGDLDDVGFTNDLIDTLHARYNIDLESVFSTGMSNGGYMSYKLACELTDRIQAIASVTGSIVPGQLALCNPSDQIPVMQIHGTDDPTVPYDGGAFAIPIEDVVAYWVGYDNCEPAVVTDVPDINTTDGCTAERFDYLTCDGDNEVAFYKITGGAHTWAGSPIPIGGNTCQDFDASDEIWKFFYKYRSPNVMVANNNISISNEVKVSPNPFRNELMIDLPTQDLVGVHVLDLNGKIVKSVAQLNSTRTIDMHSFASGVYFLQATYEKEVVVKKVVKQ